MAWQPLPLDTNPTSVIGTILAALKARIPGFLVRTASEADPVQVFAEEFGAESAALNARVQDAAARAIADIGVTVDGLAAIEAQTATLSVRLTVTGAGAVVPADFRVLGVTTAGVEVAFTLTASAVSAGATVDVTMAAETAGTLANDVPIGTLTILTATAGVISAEALAVSSGGVDAETLDAYLDRLVAHRSILRPGGVLADDLAILARSVPGVYRALGIDNYNADTDLDGEAKTATVVPIDSEGAAVSLAVAAEVQALLESVRETNFVITVGEPTYTAVNINFTAVAETGYDPVAVQAAVHAAGLEFIDPARFAAGDNPDLPTWEPITEVRYLDLARALGGVDGVAYLSSLTINGVAGDLALAGRAPLPADTDAGVPSTVTGTVS